MSLNDELWSWLGREAEGDFTADLSLCFKWLIPKLWVCEMVMHEGIFFAWRVGAPNYGEPINGGAFETPALALCKAISELIDGEK